MSRYIPSPTGTPIIDDELQKVAQAMETADTMLNLDPVYVAPKKFREGSIVFAKAPWNPGAGDGIYCFRGDSWRFLG